MQIDDAARWCRRLVARRALMAAGVERVPVPGIDWLSDVGVLLKPIQRSRLAHCRVT